MTTVFQRPTAPNLPIAPQQYSSQYGEQLNNVLRLYFNQVNYTLGTVVAAINVIETEVATLQTEVAALEVKANNAQTLIWLDM